jgi:hypothetical protein
LLRLSQQFCLLLGAAFTLGGFHPIDGGLPFCLFRLARRRQLDFVPLGRRLSSEAKELDRAILKCKLDYGNSGIAFVAELSWRFPGALLTLFGLFRQLERQDASACW